MIFSGMIITPARVAQVTFQFHAGSQTQGIVVKKRNRYLKLNEIIAEKGCILENK